MRALPLAFVVLLAASAAGAQPVPELVEGSALGGRVALLVPEGFAPMSEDLIRLKYPMEDRRPTEVLSNRRGTLNIALRHAPDALTPDDLERLRVMMSGMLETVRPGIRWNRSEVFERDGRRFLALDFWSTAVDTDIRNLMLATSVDGRLLIVSFNVTQELEAVWGPVGERVMDSVEIRD